MPHDAVEIMRARPLLQGKLLGRFLGGKNKQADCGGGRVTNTAHGRGGKGRVRA